MDKAIAGGTAGRKAYEAEVGAAKAERDFLAFKDYNYGSLGERASWVVLSAGYATAGLPGEAKMAHEMADHVACAEVRGGLNGQTVSLLAAQDLLKVHREWSMPKPDNGGVAGAGCPDAQETIRLAKIKAARIAEVMAVFRMASLAAMKMLAEAEGYEKSGSQANRELGARLRSESAVLARYAKEWMGIQEQELHFFRMGSPAHAEDMHPRTEYD